MYETPDTKLLQSQVLYVEATIRPGLTIDEYRRSRPRPAPSWWMRLRRLAAGPQAAATA
jgi:hypothetical protein